MLDIVRWYRGTAGLRINKRRLKPKAGEARLIKLTEGAQVIIDLPAVFPADIDYDWYVREAQKLVALIEDPVERNSTTIPLIDLTPVQRANLVAKRNDKSFDLDRVLGYDLTRSVERYAAKYKGNTHDSMKAILAWVWRDGCGRLSKGDLQYLAEKIDESEGYYKRRKSTLVNLVDWTTRKLSPYPKVIPVGELATQALTWASTEVKLADKPIKLWHSTTFNSSLVRGLWLNEALARKSPNKLAIQVAANAATNGFALTEETLQKILTDMNTILAKTTKEAHELPHSQRPV